MRDSHLAHAIEVLTIDRQLALETAAIRLQREFDGTFGIEPSNDSCTPPTTNSPAAQQSSTSYRCWPNASPADAATPWPRSKAKPTPASRPGYSCAPTTQAARRWRSDISPTCPLYPGRRYEEWALDDPAGQDVAAIRPIREEIETRVRHLLADLGIPTA